MIFWRLEMKMKWNETIKMKLIEYLFNLNWSLAPAAKRCVSLKLAWSTCMVNRHGPMRSAHGNGIHQSGLNPSMNIRQRYCVAENESKAFSKVWTSSSSCVSHKQWSVHTHQEHFSQFSKMSISTHCTFNGDQRSRHG